MAGYENIVGRTFGRLTVLQRVQNNNAGCDSRSQHLCLCTCGMRENVVTRYLKRGSQKTCSNCTPKRGGVNHDGKVAYWGSNAKVFEQNNQIKE